VPFDFRKLRRSFRYALAGLRYAWRHEQNFRVHIVAALVVVVLILILQPALRDTLLLILLIAFVLTLELVNTALEKVTDLLQPRIHHYAEVMKDLLAAAVFISSLTALIIGIVIFWPYFIRFIRP
jgi:undecaprenol kinase